jgi:hypothetical protein
MLFIHATHQFDWEDYEATAELLHRRYGVSTQEDILGNFYHNRESW